MTLLVVGNCLRYGPEAHAPLASALEGCSDVPRRIRNDMAREWL